MYFSQDIYVPYGCYKLKTEENKGRERVAQELQKLTYFHWYSMFYLFRVSRPACSHWVFFRKPARFELPSELSRSSHTLQKEKAAMNHGKKLRDSIWQAVNTITGFLPLSDTVSVNSPTTGLHLIPSPLHMPHLSSIASESITQSHPTLYNTKNMCHNNIWHNKNHKCHSLIFLWHSVF